MVNAIPRGLYAITTDDRPSADALLDDARQALDGGAVILQYRAKGVEQLDRDTALRLRSLCLEFKATFIVNDDPMLALDCGADGVHLGRRDASIGHARQLLGPNTVIGVSCYNELERVQRAEQAGASYVALGAFYPSRTKPDAATADLDLLRAAVGATRLPVVAIGGITPANGAPLVAAGAHALAAIDGLFAAPSIRDAARAYTQLFAADA